MTMMTMILADVFMPFKYLCLNHLTTATSTEIIVIVTSSTIKRRAWIRRGGWVSGDGIFSTHIQLAKILP